MSTDTLVVRGGLVVTPAETKALDVVVRDGHIDALVPPGEAPTGGEVIDATGLVVLPGAIDGHTHFIQDDPELFGPDPLEHEGFEAGGRGAAAGGVTTHVEMPQSRPPTTDGATFRRKRELAEADAIIDFALWGGVVGGQHPEAIAEQMAEGAVAFKAFMCDSDPTFPGVDDAQLVVALSAITGTPYMLGVHAENDALLRSGLEQMQREGRKDPLAHADSRPPLVEIEAVARAIVLAEHLGARVHIVHLSSGGAADVVAAAQARGVQVTCETCPQYLALDHGDLERLGPFARCAPPIRSRDDVDRLWEHLAAGTITCITTDHCAFTYDSRLPGHEDIFAAPNGLPGIETFVPIVVTEARRRGVSWERIAEWIAGAPARLWQLAPRKGSIQPGADADLVLLDPQRTWTIRGADLHHTHKWTPFEGREVTGRVIRTLVRGRTVFADTDGGATFAPRGTGQFVAAQGSPVLTGE
ncbi:MAG TPA: allantoinase AllB [Baekduia sp.]|nr:allantoinase AllB [Baekduia sp.]